MALIEAKDLHLAYDRREIVHGLDLALPEGRITIIVGANGCGKSTLLRGMSRLLPPTSGSVLLDGREIRSMRGKDLARRLGLLPQTPIAPDGVTVRELVSRGRFPHQGLFQQWSDADEEAVAGALASTRTDELQDRLIDELSGGQRQRVWIAMALAQQTDVLLLDEPTTYLDVTHQLEVLDVVRDLNRERGTTVAIVLHDLNLAARYADHLVAVRQGEIHSQGAPADVITEQMAHEVFALDAHISPDPVTGTPMVLPLGRDRSAPPVRHQEDTMTDTDTAADATAADATAADGNAASAAVSDEGASAPVRVSALDISPTLAFELTVARVRRIGENLVRLTFTSPELVHFGVGGHPLDLRVKLIIPGPEASTDHFANVRPSAHVAEEDLADWYRIWLQVDPADRGWMRTYTIREQRAAGHPGNLGPDPELDIDMVLHLDPDPQPGQGVAARWAAQAEEGDTITLLGPNRHLLGPDYGGIEFRPGTARMLLLVGDETAAPAICSILEALPDSMSGHALIEIPHASDAQKVLTRSNVQVSWLERGDRPHGELLSAEVERVMADSAQAFRDAARATSGPADDGAADDGAAPQEGHAPQELEDVDVDATILWETTTGHGAFYAWLAGEAGVIKALRRRLVSDMGLDRTQVSFMGYWRQGRPER